MRYGSLFSGYGGLDLAVESVLGASCAWHCELDPHASKVLAAHWPGVPNLGDISAVDWSAVEPVDVLCGGFPCQDISSAGRGAGIAEGTRSGLWYRFADAVRVLRPRLVFVENVGALVVRGLDIVVGDLAALGYDCRWTCLRASDVGAPHRRERLFLVAHPSGVGCEWGGGSWDGDFGCEGTVSGSFGDDGRGDPRPAPDAGGARLGEHAGAALGEEAGAQGCDLTADHGGTRSDRDGWPAPDAACGCGQDQPTGCWAGEQVWAVTGTGGGDRSGSYPERGRLVGGHASVVAWGPYAGAVARWERVLGRAAPSPTDERGRLSPVFVEWMMGLPAGWVTDHLPRNPALKALGNGVVPQQGAAALRMLLEPVAS